MWGKAEASRNQVKMLAALSNDSLENSRVDGVRQEVGDFEMHKCRSSDLKKPYYK